MRVCVNSGDAVCFNHHGRRPPQSRAGDGRIASRLRAEGNEGHWEGPSAPGQGMLNGRSMQVLV